MSGRNDSQLYTGATSASFTPPVAREVQKTRIDTKTKRSTLRDSLKPAKDFVDAFIEKELQALAIDYLAIEDEIHKDNYFKSEMIARKRYAQKLVELRTNFTNAVREHDA